MKVTTVTFALLAGMAIAAPAADYQTPSKLEVRATAVEPAYPTQSVSKPHYKRAALAEEPSVVEPAYPTQSVSKPQYKRSVPVEEEKVAAREVADAPTKAKKEYPSTTPKPYTRKKARSAKRPEVLYA